MSGISTKNDAIFASVQKNGPDSSYRALLQEMLAKTASDADIMIPVDHHTEHKQPGSITLIV